MGGCDVVAMLRMAGMVCLELVLQARPFLRSTDRFQYAASSIKEYLSACRQLQITFEKPLPLLGMS